ncbi:MAG: hypothetical protein ACRDQA_28715 [Nocardioidaceae bacterium]
MAVLPVLAGVIVVPPGETRVVWRSPGWTSLRCADQPPRLRVRERQAMLRRQQAGAVVVARTRIVEATVGMVELALDRLSEREIVDLDEEARWAADELRSVNARVELLLRRALSDAGRMPRSAKPLP